MDKLVLAKRLEGFSQVFAGDNSIAVDLQAMATALKGMSQEKFASIVNAGYEEEACEDKKDEEKSEKDAMFGAQPYGNPGDAYSNRTPLTERYQGAGGMKGKLTPDQLKAVARKHGIPEDKMISAYPELTASSEVAASPKQASTDGWTKEAFDAVASNLVRDVLGMNKSVCEDTGRHQTKVQDPDGDKAPGLKNVRPTEQDTGRDLTPEQVPDLKDKLDSDMYKKSKGPVKKEGSTAPICEDSGRHLTKEQMPDAEKAPELKKVLNLEQDTERALTPKQVLHKDEVLKSDMFKKSKGPVKKEAADEGDADADSAEKSKEVGTDSEKEEKANDICQKDATKKPVEKEVADLKKKQEKEEKAKKMQELKEKSQGKKEAEASESVEAGIEGISFDVSPEVLPDFQVSMNDPEIQKLSSMFNSDK